jgi:GTP-binding protein
MTQDPPRHGEGDRRPQAGGGGALATSGSPGETAPPPLAHAGERSPSPLRGEDQLEAARKLFAGPVAFLRSAPGLQFLPEPDAPEVAFAGRSNVGKSSLLNALTNRNGLARTSNTPGRTQELNFFDVGEPPRLRLVDMPGYGFAKAPPDVVRRWRFLVNDYLRGRQALKRALVLVDARHGLKDVDREILDMLDKAAVSYRLVLTKADKIKASELAAVTGRTAEEARRRPAAHPEIIATSSEGGLGVPELRAAVLEAIG